MLPGPEEAHLGLANMGKNFLLYFFYLWGENQRIGFFP